MVVIRWWCCGVVNCGVRLRWMLLILTTVRTSPGFWIRWAFTTWKTSTTLSLLQRSMVVAMAQNIPDLLTVSLEEEGDIYELWISWQQDYHLYVVATHLQWTTIGLLSVLHCTLYISSTTVMMVFGLEHLPWEFQFCIWNWVTCWDLPDYTGVNEQHFINKLTWLVPVFAFPVTDRILSM